MDNSSLNAAHFHCRRAEGHLRHLRFDEAIESHQKSIDALNETLHEYINNTKIFESIKLQRDFQVKNIELVRLKKAQYEKYKTVIDQQLQKNFSTLERRIAKNINICDIQISILKTLEESDTLLDLLRGKRSSPDTQHNAPTEASDSLANGTNVNKPRTIKSDDEIIEDMRAVNVQLQTLVFNLVSGMDESSHEIDALRIRVKTVDKNDRQRQPSSAINTNTAVSESSSKTDEPPGYSDHESRRISLSGEERKIVLPESSDLPPLELPEFDYNF